METPQIILTDDLGDRSAYAADPDKERALADLAEQRRKDQFWRNLVPGRRTQAPTYPIYTTRHDQTLSRRKRHRRYFRELDEKNAIAGRKDALKKAGLSVVDNCGCGRYHNIAENDLCTLSALVALSF